LIREKIISEKTIIAELSDVWVGYDGKWVLKSIYLDCRAGEILGIVGPNGAGKSTLLKVILGLIQPDRGNVTLFGMKPGRAARLEAGYLPQISHAERSFPVTALDVVLMGIYNRIGLFRKPGLREKETAMEMLSRVNMTEHAGQPFGSLSGGQQQRIHIARALASKPKLLLLDEPSTGVDSVAQEDFYILLAKLRDEEGLSVIMVSHDIGVITSHADRVACLNTEVHYHGGPELCLSPEIMEKVFGKDLKIMVHDSRCATCNKRHIND
jgi:zinc transport system ATP-binding protein